MLQANILDLRYLITDQPTTLHVATQLSQRVGRYWLVLGRAQIFKASGGLLQLGIEAADAEPDQRCFHSVDNPSLLSDEALALAVGPLGIFVLGRRDRHHLAVIPLAPHPADEGAFEQLGVAPVGLGAPVLARYGYARCVDDVGLDAACPQPARQPETIPASLEGDCNAFDPASCLLGFLAPSMQQLQQCTLVDRKLLQRLGLDAKHDTSHEPAPLAHLQDTDTMLWISTLKRRYIIASTPMREWLCPLPHARFIATSSSYSWVCQTARWRSHSECRAPRRQLSARRARPCSLSNIYPTSPLRPP